MTPEQHRQQAEVLLNESREAFMMGGDPKSPSYEARMRRAELFAQRAIGHALVAGLGPMMEVRVTAEPPSAVELLREYDAQQQDLDGGRP